MPLRSGGRSVVGLDEGALEGKQERSKAIAAVASGSSLHPAIASRSRNRGKCGASLRTPLLERARYCEQSGQYHHRPYAARATTQCRRSEGAEEGRGKTSMAASEPSPSGAEKHRASGVWTGAEPRSVAWTAAVTA